MSFWARRFGKTGSHRWFSATIWRATELYHASVTRKIIVAGALGKHPSAEAEAGHIFLIESGVTDANIIRETDGMTTAG